MKTKIMIAGIGGASLGTEILKSLLLAGRYEVYGADIYPSTYGLYDPGFARTYLLSAENYVADLLTVCRAADIHYLIPGAEKTTIMLAEAEEKGELWGIHIVGNAPKIIRLCSDKQRTFWRLADLELPTPRTSPWHCSGTLDNIGLPCIIKPSTNSGGSTSVFFATTADEAATYAEFIVQGGGTPIAQEYIPDTEGEFTIGVLSLPDGCVAGSVALRRALTAKLSCSYNSRGGIISSGYSQGLIADFPDLRRQAEAIAIALGSRGPLNIQGRARAGHLLPFEINPRFSASTYLRAIAGFNETDILLRHLIDGEEPASPQTLVRTGWYLRSLSEIFVPESQIKSTEVTA